MENLINQIVLDIQYKLANFLTLRPLVLRARKVIPASDTKNLQVNASIYSELEKTEKQIFNLLPKAMEVKKGVLKDIPKLLFDAIELNKKMNILTTNTSTHLSIIKKLYGGDFSIPKATALDYMQLLPLALIPLFLLLISKKK